MIGRTKLMKKYLKTVIRTFILLFMVCGVLYQGSVVNADETDNAEKTITVESGKSVKISSAGDSVSLYLDTADNKTGTKVKLGCAVYEKNGKLHYFDYFDNNICDISLNTSQYAIITSYGDSATFRYDAKKSISSSSTSGKALHLVKLEPGKSVEISNNQGIGTDIKNTSSVGMNLDLARYNSKGECESFSKGTLYTSYLYNGETEVITNKSKDTSETIYYPGSYDKVVSKASKENAIAEFELKPGKSIEITNNQGVGTSIENTTEASNNIDWAVYDKNGVCDNLTKNTYYLSYLKDGYTEVVTNKSTDKTDIVYYPNRYNKIVSKDTALKALTEIELKPGKSIEITNNQGVGTSIENTIEASNNIDWAVYDTEGDCDNFTKNVYYLSYLKDGYTEVVTNKSTDKTDIIYFPQKYQNIICSNTENQALFETDIAVGGSFTYENKYECNVPFEAISREQVQLDIELKYKSGLVEKYNNSYPRDVDDETVKESFTNVGKSIVTLYAPYKKFYNIQRICGDSNIDSVTYVNDNERVNVIADQKRIKKGFGNEVFSLECKFKGNKVTKCELLQGSNVIATADQNGVFNNISTANLKPDVYLNLKLCYGADQDYTVTRINLFYLDLSDSPIDELNILGSGALTIPESIPVLGGREIEVSDFSLPISAELEEDYTSWKVLFNIWDNEDDEVNDANEDKEAAAKKAAYDDVKRYIKKIKQSGTTDLNKNISGAKKSVIKDYLKGEKKKTQSGGLSINAMGYAEYAISDKGVSTLNDGGVIVTVTYEKDGSYYTYFHVIPINFKYNYGLKATATASLKDMSKGKGFTLNISGDIGIAGGLGGGITLGGEDIDIAYIDVAGDVSGDLALRLGNVKNLNPFEQLALDAKIYIKAKALWYDYESEPLLEGKCAIDKGGNVTGSLSTCKKNLVDTAAYTQAKVYNSSWQSGVIDTEENLYRSSGQSSGLYDTSNELIAIEKNSNISSAPITASNGNTAMMIYAGDDISKSRNNTSTLKYSILGDDGVWSAPKSVDSNNSPDFDHVAFTYNGDIYVCYQQATSEIGADETLDSGIKKLGITVAKYDEASDSFIDLGTVSSDGTYNSAPAINIMNGKLTVAWVENTGDDYFKRNNLNSIKYVQYDGTQWSEPVVLVSNSNCISSLNIANIGGSDSILYKVDNNNNLSDESEYALNRVDLSGNIETWMTGNVGNIKNVMIGNTAAIMWHDNDGIKYVFSGTNDIKTVSDLPVGQLVDYTLSGNRLYYIVKGEDTYNLCACDYLSDGTWSGSYTLVSDNSLLKDFSVVNRNGSDIAVLAKKTQIGSGDKVDITTELDCANLKNFYDTEFYDVDYDITTMKDDATVDFRLGVINNSSSEINQLFIEMKDVDGNDVYSGVISQKLAIGENKVIEQSIKMPDKLADKYTISIMAASDDKKLNEQNNNDNSQSICVRQSNLEISAVKHLFKDNDEADVTIKNSGTSVATAKISLINDSDKVVMEKEIGCIQAGESITSNIVIDKEYFSNGMNYGDSEAFRFVVTVGEDEKNANEYANSVSLLFEKKTFTRLELKDTSKQMNPGETTKIELLNKMPEEVRYISKNENVAKVDENGNITAIGAGKTTLSVCSGEQRKEMELTVVPIETSKNVEVEYEGASITISNMIGVNFYVTLSDKDIKNADAYMKFELADGTVRKVKVSDAKSYSGKPNTKIFTCKMAAAEMADIIKAQLIVPEADGKVKTSEVLEYSVKQYCQYILDNQNAFDANMVQLVKYILNYGSYSQIYFKHNSNNLANDILQASDRTLTKKSELMSAASTFRVNNVDGLKYYGRSLILNSKTVMRVYFEVSDNRKISDFEFKCGDKVLKPVKSGGLYYVDIADITPAEYGKVFSIMVSGKQFFSSGVYDYCRNVISSNTSTDKLKDLAVSMYELGTAVKYNK